MRAHKLVRPIERIRILYTIYEALNEIFTIYDAMKKNEKMLAYFAIVKI